MLCRPCSHHSFPHRALQKTLEREARQCQVLVIWTDCDREGENIGFEIIHVCKAGECLLWGRGRGGTLS